MNVTGKCRARIAAVSLILGALLAASPVRAESDDHGDSRVHARDDVVFGRTYAEWSAEWRQWADSFPALQHPLFDTAPCTAGQSGPVWFLGGRFCAIDINPSCANAPAVRSCTVPAGKALYLPVLNISCLDAEAKNGLCLSAGPLAPQMRAVIADIMDRTSDLRVTVDGRRITGDLKSQFRVQSPVYTTLLPDGNLYQALGEPVITAGSYFAVDDGVYVMLKPLSKGNHVVNFRGSFPPEFNFTLDFTYLLTVQ